MNIKGKISVGFVCILLGIAMSIQYKVIQSNYLNGLSPAKRQSDLTNEFIALQSEKKKLEAELTEAKVLLLEIEATASEGNSRIKELQNKISEYELLAGLSEVIGQGIVISINTPSEDSNPSEFSGVIYHYELILQLVNELNASGAEAISINDQRLVSTSEIRTAGENINVNSVPLTTPIIIKAIGKKSALEGAITTRFGIVDQLRMNSDLIIDVKTRDEITLPMYTGSLDFDYIKTIKE